jgi:Holliday junction resolvase RusA-like endonuclease
MRAIGGRVVSGGDRASQERLASWRRQVAWSLAAAHRGEPFDGPCTVSIEFRFLIPASRARHATEGQPRTVYPDLDKLVRAVFDAVTTAGVWTDDARCAELACTKTETTGKAGARITIKEIT